VPAAEPEAEPDEEGQAKAQGATRLQKLLRTQFALLQSIRTARAATAAQLPWRAQARLLLAICTALMPPPPPAEAEAPAEPEPQAAEPAAAAAEGEGEGEGEEESEAASAEKEGGGGGGGGKKKKEQLPQPMVPDEGSAALVEFGRAAVLAWSCVAHDGVTMATETKRYSSSDEFERSKTIAIFPVGSSTRSE